MRKALLIGALVLSVVALDCCRAVQLYGVVWRLWRLWRLLAATAATAATAAMAATAAAAMAATAAMAAMAATAAVRMGRHGTWGRGKWRRIWGRETLETLLIQLSVTRANKFRPLIA